jgi:capsular exopolysaccharide synthesis family protein
MADAADRQDLQLTHWLRLLRRRGVAFALTVLVFLAAGAAFVLLRSPEYQAQVDVGIASSDPNSPVPAETDVTTVTQLAGSDEVARRAKRDLPGPVHATVVPSEQAAFLTIRVRAATPRLAARGANAYGRALVAVRAQVTDAQYQVTARRLESSIRTLDDQLQAIDQPGPSGDQQRQQLQSQRDAYEAAFRDLQVQSALSSQQRDRVIASATVPDAPVGFGSARILTAAGLLGALVAVAVVALLEYADRSVRPSGSLTPIAGTWVRAVIPAAPDRNCSRFARLLRALRLSPRRPVNLLLHVRPEHRASQAYRALRTSLLAGSDGEDLGVLNVTSARSDDGAAVAAANIALSFALAGRRTTLVSLDSRRPTEVAAFPGEITGPGFASVVCEGRDLDDVSTPYAPVEDLRLIGAGVFPGSPSDILAQPLAREVLEKLSSREEIVVFLLPPVLVSPESALVAGTADTTLLVAIAGETRAADLSKAVDRLVEVGASLPGVVLVEARPTDSD